MPRKELQGSSNPVRVCVVVLGDFKVISALAVSPGCNSICCCVIELAMEAVERKIMEEMSWAWREVIEVLDLPYEGIIDVKRIDERKL